MELKDKLTDPSLGILQVTGCSKLSLKLFDFLLSLLKIVSRHG
jgi:hypothetical protein